MQNARTSSPSRELALVGLAALVFATSGPVAKLIGTIHPLAVASGRTGLAALGLMLWDGPRIVRVWRGATRSDVWKGLAAGVLLACHFAAYLWGLATTSLAAASALISLEPVAVLAVAALVQGLHPRATEVVGVIIATVGAGIVSSAAGDGDHRLVGDLLVVASVFLYGFYVAVAREVRPEMEGRPYAAFVYAIASLVILPVLPFVDGALRAPSARDSFAVLVLALFPTLVGHTLVQRAASRVRPAVLALVSPGETIGSIAIGAFMLRMPPSLREGIGIAVVLLGTTLAASAGHENEEMRADPGGS